MTSRFQSRRLFASLLAGGMFTSAGLFTSVATSQDQWTDSSGARTVEAEFVALDGVQLKLKKTDGSEVVLPLFKLDEASRRLARQKAQALASGTDGAEETSTTGNHLPLAISETAVPFPPTLSLQEHFQLIESEYNKGNYLVEWDAIPRPYQAVIEDYFATAISKLDPPIFQELEQLQTRWVNTLKAKREFILNSPSLGWDADTKVMATNAYDPLVGLLASLPPGAGFDPATVQKTPLRETMKVWIEKLLPQLDRIVEVLPGARESFFATRPSVANTRFIVINQDSAQAIVTRPGKPPTTTDWIRYQSMWVPKDYQKAIDDIYFANERLAKEDADSFNLAIRQQITAASLAVGVLEASQSQSDIDDVLRGVKTYSRGLLPFLLRGSAPSGSAPGSSGYGSSGYPNSGYPNTGYPDAGSVDSGSMAPGY